MDLLSGNWQYQVTKSGSVLTSCPAPANMTLVPVAIMNENSQISFNNIGFDFCTIENPLYAELKKQLDESFYMVNEKLGIKYKSKYANDVVNYTIYDWKRNPMATGSFSSGGVLVNGYNYLQMDLSGMSLQRMNSYVLEVTDPKGEVYKLKFQYLQ